MSRYITLSPDWARVTWWSILSILVGAALVINFASFGIVNTDPTLTSGTDQQTLDVVNASLGLSVIVIGLVFAYMVYLAVINSKLRTVAQSFGRIRW
jgi:uncharacterized membrane protein